MVINISLFLFFYFFKESVNNPLVFGLKWCHFIQSALKFLLSSPFNIPAFCIYTNKSNKEDEKKIWNICELEIPNWRQREGEKNKLELAKWFNLIFLNSKTTTLLSNFFLNQWSTFPTKILQPIANLALFNGKFRNIKEDEKLWNSLSARRTVYFCRPQFKTIFFECT